MWPYLQEEKMGRNHSQLGTWALALMTCLVVAGANSAYAWDNQARVNAGGQFFHNDPANILNGSDRVSFGIEGKCSASNKVCAPNGINPPFTCDPTGTSLVVPACPFNPVPAGGPAPRGNFEYFNKDTGLRAHGRITDVSFGTASPACVAFGDPNLAGKPSAIVQGKCDDGKCSQFQMEVVDGDDTSPKAGDWVCNVNVTGQNKMHIQSTDSEPAQQVIRGGVEVETSGHH
jgi:hypothetical protein